MLRSSIVCAIVCLFSLVGLQLVQSQFVTEFRGWDVSDVALDSNGNIYVADQANKRVLKFNQNGNQLASFTTTPALGRPNCVALDLQGNIYIVDYFASTIVMLASNGTELNRFVISTTYLYISDVIVDSTGNIFVAVKDNNSIVKLAANGTRLATFTSGLVGPSAIAVASNGNIFVAETNNDRVVQLNSNGQLISIFGPGRPLGLTIDASGNIIVLTSDTIYKYASSVSNGTAPTSRFTLPHTSYYISHDGIAIDSRNGNIVYTQYSYSRIDILTSLGSPVSNIVSRYTAMEYTTGVAVKSNGNILVADSFNRRILELSNNGTEVSRFTVPRQPYRIAVDGNDNVYVGDISSNVITKFAKNGTQSPTTFTVLGATSTGITYGIAADATGNAYVADIYLNRIVKFAANGTLIANFTTSPSLSYPIGVGLDRAGNIYVADRFGYRIVKLNSTGAQVGSFPFGTFEYAIGVSIAPNGEIDVVTDSSVIKLAANGTRLSFTSPLLSNANAISVDALGRIYVVDADNRVVVLSNTSLAQVQSSSSSSSSSTGGSSSSSFATSSPRSGVRGDPQFVGFRGQSFQVHGIDGVIYNIITDQQIQLNARFMFLSGPRACPVMPSTNQPSRSCWSHDGSYLSEIGLMVRATGERVYIKAGSADKGFEQVIANTNSTSCVQLNSHELIWKAGPFEIEIENIDGFVNLRSVVVSMSLDKLSSHGLLGQTWRKPSKLIKNVVEGDIDDYAVAGNDIFGVRFPFSRYADQ